MFKYLVWSGLTGLGAVLAYVDFARLRRPWLGLALLVMLGGGYAMTLVFPFSFADASLFMTGVVLAAAAGLGLCGYALVSLVFVVRRQLASLRR